MKNLWLLLLSVTVISSCNFIGGERIDGDGDLATETRQADDFKNVAASGSIDIMLTQAPDFSVQVKGDKNLLPYVIVDVDGNTLKIKTKKGYNLRPKQHLEVDISAPVFNTISSDGSGNVTTQNTLTNKDKISFELSGSGNIQAKVDADALESETSGSGNVSFSGRADDAEMSVAGSGNIHCFSLTTENTSITINGSGNADVYATKKLNLTVNGSGDIQYKGSATVDSHINGSGSVSKKD